MKKTSFLAIAASGAAIVGVLTFGLTERGPATDRCFGSTVAGGAIGGPFSLLNSQGDIVTDQTVITEPSIIYFGYSFCPDVCPVDAARNTVAVDILAEVGHSATPIFISIDPDRDTPEVIGDYAELFHPKMIGLTGSSEQVKAAANAYRVVYSKADDDPDFYLMSHSVFSYFVTPEAGFVTFFRREDSPEVMADQIGCYLSAT